MLRDIWEELEKKMRINIIIFIYIYVRNSQEHRKIKNIKRTLTTNNYGFNVFSLGSIAWSHAAAMEKIYFLFVVGHGLFSLEA